MVRPLSPELVSSYARALFNGQGVNLRNLLPGDAVRILGEWVRLSVAAWELAQMERSAAEGLVFERRVRSRPAKHRKPSVPGTMSTGGPGSPSEIVIDILASPEAVALLNILSALVVAGGAILPALLAPRPLSLAERTERSGKQLSVVSSYLEGTDDRRSAKARAITALIRKKARLVGVCGKGDIEQLPRECVAWTNAICLSEAQFWMEAGNVRMHYADILTSGGILLDTWRPPLARLGVRLEAVDLGPFLDLPAYDPFEWSPPELPPPQTRNAPGPRNARGQA